MKSIQLCTLVALVFVALFSWKAPAVAQDTGIVPEKKLAKELQGLADVCYEMGIKAKDRGIYNFAKSFFNHALLYDPDHRETRKILGFKKKGKDWVGDKEDYGMPTSNTVRKEKEAEAFGKVWDETKDLRTKAADKLFEFVADEKLDTRQRILALHHLMLIDPLHDKAHRAAGLEAAAPGTSESPWLHSRDRDFAHQRNTWNSGTPDAAVVTDKTPYEETLGLTLAKARGERFFFHIGTDLNAETLAQTLTPFADSTWKRAHEYLGLTLEEAPKEDAKRLHYSVFQTRDKYAQFIEKCAGIEDAARRKEIAEQGYGYATRKPNGNVWLYPFPNEPSALRDGVAHEIGSYIIGSKCGYRLYWLNRGLGFTLSNRAMGTVKATFVTIKGTAIIDSGGVESMPGLGTNAGSWRFKVILAIAGGKSLNLKDLTQVSPSGFTELHGAFAFGYTEFLLEKHQAKLAPFLEDAYNDTYQRYQKKEKTESPDDTLNRLLKHLDLPIDKIQTDFAAWAAENYLKLPKKES